MGFYDFAWAGNKALPLLKELMWPIYELSRTDGDERPFLGATNAWAVGSMLMTDGYQTALHYKRTLHAIRRDGCDEIVLHLLRRGAVRGDFAGSDETAGSGQILCYDRARPFHVRNDDNLSVTLSIPRHDLEAVTGPIGNLHGQVLGGPASALLRDHMLSLARLGGYGCDTESITSATLSLVAAALGSEVQHDLRVPPVMARAQELIDAKLASEDLSIDLICRDLGVSRSVLYRHFAADGGVERYIFERRLKKARTRLMQQPPVRISDLAFELGFQDASHFSTAYRLRFGQRPSETLRQARGSKSELNAALRVAQWIQITGEPSQLTLSDESARDRARHCR